jgi:hypothetical protein
VKLEAVMPLTRERANLAAHKEDAEAIGKTGRKKCVANIFWREF